MTDNNNVKITIYVITQSIYGVMIYNNKNISSKISEENDYKFLIKYTLIFEAGKSPF